MILIALHVMVQLLVIHAQSGKFVELVSKTKVLVDSSWILEDIYERKTLLYL
jgi:hypothetical protein